ncbi:ribosomal protein S18 acetylase RimI-like enzyme [Paenibacillus amylolyticus]|uniref:Ribosomal protein S18 acetylase RimI-like enzyme n=1 Tax=Paenibacillus amylolyticus TaxID=1451 RepID=A0AAP5H6S0_PAEAM|nr:GNAT family N-acetyltransferase [Paenibacillus amylolyticus]MDR6727425.1 ribosomal protein S18 acetylase RimI-like enzyme [Paenibacillus amylolyticus]
MTDIVVRSIDERDVPFLWEMLYASLYTRAEDEPFERDIIHSPGLSKYVEGWGRVGDFGFVAVATHGGQDRRLGSITLRFFNEQNAGFGYVNAETPEMGMAIIEEARGQGVGTRLIQAALEEAKQRGIAAVSLSVDPDNEAIRLYRRFGFVEVGMCDTSVTMVCTIQ